MLKAVPRHMDSLALLVDLVREFLGNGPGSEQMAFDLDLVIARQDTPHARQLRLVEPAAHDDATMAHVTPLDHMDNRQAA